jgi:glycosyltransferase involved in cell wall biosynthesis
VEAAKWQGALATLGFSTLTVAGAGPVDRLLPGLSIGAAGPPGRADLARALDDADLVVVENVCSLPLNPGAARVVAEVLAGRPAILHHHDLPWQRARYRQEPPPPTDRRWSQVTINELSRHQLARRGIEATTIYNTFAVGPCGDGAEPPGTDVGQGRRRVRTMLGMGDDRRIVLQPTRAIPRKNVAGGIRVATELGATFWLLGPAEDGSPEGQSPLSIDDAYRACDVVALPSTWEGFGNPSVESAVQRRPLAIGPYPVADELAAFGFEWFALDEMDRLRAWMDAPDPGLLDRNLAVASAHFALSDLPARIAAVLPEL